MIYLDSNIVIYAVEGEESLQSATRRILTERPKADFVVSPLVEMECLVHPIRNGDYRLADRYREFLGLHRNIEPDREVYLRAAGLRADNGLKALDAIHLALAQLSGCEALWTNDDRLERASGGLAVKVV